MPSKREAPTPIQPTRNTWPCRTRRHHITLNVEGTESQKP